MPDGEQPLLLGSNAGVLLILTTSDTEEEADIGEGPEVLQAIRVYQSEVLDARFDYIVGQLQPLALGKRFTQPHRPTILHQLLLILPTSRCMRRGAKRMAKWWLNGLKR